MSSRIQQAIAATLLLSSFASIMPEAVAQNKPAAKAKASETQADFGLEVKALQLANRGDWKGVIARLESLPQPDAAAQGWLAFAYMFQGQCDDLHKLEDKVNADANKDPLYSKLVSAFDLTCRNKLEDAVSAANDLPKGSGGNVLANFGRAAIAGKMGKSAMAMHLVQKTVDAAPNFGWGYRTLAYMQQRWFKDSAGAQENLEKALAISPDFAEARDLLVDAKLTNNDFDGAVEVAQAGIKAGPRDANNYYRLAQIYIQQWRLKEALGQLDRAIALAPNDARFHRSRASILRYQGNLNDAIAEQQKAVDLSKEKAFELVQLAGLNLQAGNTNRAADNLREALKTDPDNQAAHQKLTQILSSEKRYDDLVEEYQRAIARKPKAADLHLGLARALKFAGKLDEAGKEFIEASNLDPNDPQPHREMGALHIQNKDLTAAAKSYTRALNLNPSSTEDFVALGYCYAQNEDFMQAEAAFITAMAMQQLNPAPGPAAAAARMDVMRALAGLLLAEGRYGDAASQFEAIVALTKKTGAQPLDEFLLAQCKMLRDSTVSSGKAALPAFDALPEDQKKHQRLPFVEALVEVGQFDSAAALLDQLPAKEKNDALALACRSAVLRGKGDAAEAERVALQAVATAQAAKTPDHQVLAQALVELAQAQIARDDLNGAAATVDKAIVTNSKSYVAYELSGRIYLKKGDKDPAMEAAKKSLEINPYWARSYMVLGDAQAASDDFKDAMSQYRKAAELYPGLLEAHKLLLNSYKKLALNDEVKQEEEAIAQMEQND